MSDQTVSNPPTESRAARMVRIQFGLDQAREGLLGVMSELDALGHMGAHLRACMAAAAIEDCRTDSEHAERTFKELEALDDRWERHERGE